MAEHSWWTHPLPLTTQQQLLAKRETATAVEGKEEKTEAMAPCETRAETQTVTATEEESQTEKEVEARDQVVREPTERPASVSFSAATTEHWKATRAKLRAGWAMPEALLQAAGCQTWLRQGDWHQRKRR